MVKKLWRYVKPFSYNTSVSRTDRQTDRRTDRIAISISRVSSRMLTRDKNVLYASPASLGELIETTNSVERSQIKSEEAGMTAALVKNVNEQKWCIANRELCDLKYRLDKLLLMKTKKSTTNIATSSTQSARNLHQPTDNTLRSDLIILLLNVQSWCLDGPGHKARHCKPLFNCQQQQQ